MAHLAESQPVDFTTLLPVELLVHVCRFVDGEDLLALERTCHTLQSAVGDLMLWKQLLESKRRQITFVPFISEKDRVHGCRNWEEKHRYFRSCVWNSVSDLPDALLVAEQSPLGGEIHLLPGVYKGLLLEGWSVDMSIIGHGDVVIENTSAWRPPIHICSESSLNPSAFMREQLSYVAGYVPETLSRYAPKASYILPEYLSSLFRTPADSPTIVLEGLEVRVGASAEQISTFPIYVEGQTHVVVHKCVIVGQRLSAILVSKVKKITKRSEERWNERERERGMILIDFYFYFQGAQCDVIDSDISQATEDGVFYVFGGGSVRGCRIHSCAMNAIEVRGASRDVVIENNVITRNGCGLHVPWREGQAATGLQEIWNGKIHFVNNQVKSLHFDWNSVALKFHFSFVQVFDNMGPSIRVERCNDNPHMGTVSNNVFFGNAEQRPLSHRLQQALDKGVCTGSATGDRHDYQVRREFFVLKLKIFYFLHHSSS